MRTSPKGQALLRRGGGQKRGGRPKGGEVTKNLWEATLLAAEQIGEDGRGRDGLVGYLRRMARTNPRSFDALLGRVPPDEIIRKDNGPQEYETLDEVKYETLDEVKEALRERGIPMEGRLLV
jgi:hypothetical protein